MLIVKLLTYKLYLYRKKCIKSKEINSKLKQSLNIAFCNYDYCFVLLNSSQGEKVIFTFEGKISSRLSFFVTIKKDTL